MLNTWTCAGPQNIFNGMAKTINFKFDYAFTDTVNLRINDVFLDLFLIDI